ncbi:hypothetical protein Pan54_01220 [Rubinisphaera italica]|uniref:Uncharacterized protein n=1 Tax=Rubinisphaera italica TaxID=2527969 RepID=A0A5C5X8T6_9PLAN|nr:hypothetical protein Pan54_01220 [Rubinisphaera italica]
MIDIGLWDGHNFYTAQPSYSPVGHAGWPA